MKAVQGPYLSYDDEPFGYEDTQERKAVPVSYYHGSFSATNPMKSLMGRAKNTAANVANTGERIRATEGRIDIRAPFVTVGTTLQLTTEKRPLDEVKSVTWNTMQFTPVIIVDTAKRKLSLMNMSAVLPFMLASGTFRDFLTIDSNDEWLIKQITNAKTGKAMFREAMENIREGMMKGKDAYDNLFVRRQSDDGTIKDVRFMSYGRVIEWYNYIVKSCTTIKLP
jgi:hypothetical protein